jgi:hypothetical protein
MLLMSHIHIFLYYYDLDIAIMAVREGCTLRRPALSPSGAIAVKNIPDICSNTRVLNPN